VPAEQQEYVNLGHASPPSQVDTEHNALNRTWKPSEIYQIQLYLCQWTSVVSVQVYVGVARKLVRPALRDTISQAWAPFSPITEKVCHSTLSNAKSQCVWTQTSVWAADSKNSFSAA
jgi:hypothetical protein